MRTVDTDDARRAEGRADFVSSLAAGLRVLNAFTSTEAELGVGALARALNMDQRRTQRLVSTLYELGFLEQDEATRKYRPGIAVLDLGYAALQSLDVRQVAQPFLRELLAKFGQSVNLAVHDRLDVVLVECLRGEPYRIGVQLCVGDRYPVHLSSLGRAILSRLRKEELAGLLERVDYHPVTPHSVTSRTALERQLRRTHERGYAVQDQETGLGVRSVAAAVTRRDGSVAGAINVAMPTPMMPMDQLEAEVAPHVVDVARRISDRLTPGGRR